MRKVFIFIGLLLGYSGINIRGQIDSIIPKDSIKLFDNVDNRIEQKSKYLNANLREEKILFKFGIRPLYYFTSKESRTYASFGSSLIVEKKIIPSFSFLVRNNFSFGMFEHFNYWAYSGDLELRFYYSIRKRIRESIGANNFHSNYLSVRLDKCLTYLTTANKYSYQMNSGDRKWGNNPDFSIAWGLQRRIGKWGFVDVGPYLSFTKHHPTLGANMVLGLGYGK